MPGAELVPFCRVRPSARAGDANRNSAAAAPAALEEMELRSAIHSGWIRFRGRFRSASRPRDGVFAPEKLLFAQPTRSETTREDARDRRGGRHARYRDASTRDASARDRRARVVVVVSAPRALASPPIAPRKENLREIKDAGNRGCTYADFCCLAATLVAFTCAVARTVVWAATANILTEKGVGVLRDGGCRNDPRPDLVAGFGFDGILKPSVDFDSDSERDQ